MKQTLLTVVLAVLSTWNLSAQNNFAAGISTDVPVVLLPSASRTICDTVFSFQTVDTWPGGITSDGDYIFNTGNNSGYIYKYSFTGAVVDSFVNPAAALTNDPSGDMDYDGNSLLFLAEEMNTIYKMSPSTGAVLSQLNVAPCTGNCFGVAYDGPFIWVCDYSPTHLYKLDAATGALINNFPITTPALALSIKFMNGRLYGLGINPPTIFEFDTTSGNVISSQPWCLGYPLGFCTANNHFWGLSSWIAVGGTQHIYEFDSSLVTDVPVNFSKDYSFKIFPNPTGENTTISIIGVKENSTIEIVNLLEEKIYRQNITTAEREIHLENISAGIYFVKLYTRERMHTEKLIVE